MSYDNYPLRELYERANEILEESRGKAAVFFKWTCGACGERVTTETPNVIYTSGEHQDCTVTPGFVTDTKATGGNYMVMQAGTPDGVTYMQKTLGTHPRVTMTSMGAVDKTTQQDAMRNL